MKNEDQEPIDTSFIDQPITKFEALRLIQPLRSVLGDLVGSMVDATSALIAEAETKEGALKARAAFERLREVFDNLEDYDCQSMRLLSNEELELMDEEIEPTNNDGKSHE